MTVPQDSLRRILGEVTEGVGTHAGMFSFEFKATALLLRRGLIRQISLNGRCLIFRTPAGTAAIDQ